MAQASDDKVFQFEEAIMAKAARQQQEILDEVKKDQASGTGSGRK